MKAGTRSWWSSNPTRQLRPEPVEGAVLSPSKGPSTSSGHSRSALTDPAAQVILQVSRFPWGEDPTRWLVDLARTADELGFAGLALMDHLIQIPQVDRAWEPIPEPYVTLGLLAGLDTRLRLGTLVSPVTFRRARNHRQGGGHARRAEQRPRLLRPGGRLVAARAPGVRAGLSSRSGAAGPAAGVHRDPARVVGSGHQGPPRPLRAPAGDHLLPAAGGRGADSGRRGR